MNSARRVWTAPAKLNLFLHIVGRRPDGYHELQTCFQFVDLCDEIAIEVRADGQVRRGVEIAGLPEDQDLCVAGYGLRGSASRQGDLGVAIRHQVLLDRSHARICC